MKRYGLILAAIFLVESAAGAQNFQIYNFGENEISSFNAAAIMDDGNMAYFRGRYDWYNSELYHEKPYNFEVGGNAVGKWGGISAQLSYDEYSYFKRHNLNLNYAYQWRTGICNQHHFSISGGLSLGIDDYSEQYIMVDGKHVVGCNPDFNIGFEYSNDRWRAGIGGINLVGTKYLVDGSAVTRNPRVILAYFRYRWNIKDVVGISPMAFVGYSEKTLIEVDLRFDYKKIVYFSYGFRAMDLRHILVLNLNIPKTPITFDMGYSFAQFYYAQALSAGITARF